MKRDALKRGVIIAAVSVLSSTGALSAQRGHGHETSQLMAHRVALELTDAQVQQLRAIEDELRSQERALDDQVLAIRRDVEDGTVGQNEGRRLIQEARTAVREASAPYSERAEQVLSVDQRVQLLQLQRSSRSNHSHSRRSSSRRHRGRG